jgi:hypothetical protein
MPWLYGQGVPAFDYQQLLERLRANTSPQARLAAETLSSRGTADRHASPQSTELVREAILDELGCWADLDSASPALAGLRDRLAAPAAAREAGHSPSWINSPTTG